MTPVRTGLICEARLDGDGIADLNAARNEAVLRQIVDKSREQLKKLQTRPKELRNKFEQLKKRLPVSSDQTGNKEAVGTMLKQLEKDLFYAASSSSADLDHG